MTIRKFLLTHSILLVMFSLITGCGGGGGGSNTPEPPPSEDVVLESIGISNVEQTLKASETLQLTAIGRFSDGSLQNISASVSWNSGAPDIVGVSDSGNVSALSAGTAVITASLDSVSSQTQISVKELEELSISPSNLSIAVNTSEQLSIVGRYSDNSIETLNDEVQLESTNTDIVTVSDNRVVQGLAQGSAEITASLGDIESQTTVVVTSEALQSLAIVTNNSSLPVGLSTQLSAIGTFSDGSEQDLSSQSEWSSSNPSVASVDIDTGLVSALSAGVVDVTAQINGVSESIRLIVNEAQLTNIVLSPSTVSVAKGTSVQVEIIGTFSDGSTRDITNQVSASVLDQQIASYNQQAQTLTGLQAGDTQLQVSLLGIEESANVNVREANLVSIELSDLSNNTLSLGQQKQYSAAGVFSDGSQQDISDQVTWLSSNQTSVVISNADDSKGVVQASALGTSVISAVLDEIEVSTQLSVVDTSLQSLEVNIGDTSLSPGLETSIQVIGIYSDGASLDLTSQAVFSASVRDIIDLQTANSGSISVLASGEAVISVTFEGIVGLNRVKVNNAVLESVTVRGIDGVIPLSVDLPLMAIGNYSDGTEQDLTQLAVWQSSNETNISVSNEGESAGRITGNVAGSATISALFDGLQGRVNLTIDDVQVQEIDVQLTSNQLVVNRTVSAVAIATLSNGTEIDLTEQVRWITSDTNVAWASNEAKNAGTVTGLQSGTTNLTASLRTIVSEPEELQVVSNANIARRISLSFQPNFIISDGIDSSTVSITLIPTEEDGTIPDGTAVTLSIIEDNQRRDLELGTENGIATFDLSTSNSGFISIESGSGDLVAKSGVIASNTFVGAFGGGGFSRVSFNDNTLRTDSVLLVLFRNLSNREFELERVNIGYIEPSNNNTFVNFPESPITDPTALSNGLITAGEFHFIAYEVTEDIEANEFVIAHAMLDRLTDEGFSLDAVFDFSEVSQP